MAVGYRNSAGTDFDDLFEPRGSATKAPNVGYKDSSGVDLSNRYYPLSEGGSAIASNTLFRNSAGTDLRNIFAGIGTVSTAEDVVLPADFTAGATAADPNNSWSSVEFRSDGHIYHVYNTGGGTATQTVDKGIWLDNLSGLDANLYEVIAVFVSGTVPSGELQNTYYSLDSGSLSWRLDRTSVGTTQYVGDFTVREKANHSNNDTCRITIRSTVIDPI